MILACLCAASAVADDSPARHSKAEQASYTTGPRGNRLKWLPCRPSKRQVVSRAVATEQIGRATSETRVRTVQRDVPSPFDDPFGDGQLLDLPTEKSLPPLDSKLDVQPDTGTDEVKMDTLEREMAKGPLDLTDKCPSPDDFKPIKELTTDIAAEGDDFPRECGLGDKTFEPRVWAPTTFTWKASGLCHKPLYFEDVHLERYGHSWGPYLQPIISGGHFFLTVPVLPYKMGLYPPGECMYTLGYYRPGNCAPYMLDPLPLSVRAALFEGAAWTGMVYAIP